VPKEYVYKIVLDDAEVDRVLTSIDTRIEALAKKADTSFQNVGRNMGTGLKQAVAETQSASRQIQQTEQQTTQQIQQRQRQAASGAKKTSQQRVQAARVAGQAEVQSAQQAVAARKEDIRVLDEQIAKLKQLSSAASADVQQRQGRIKPVLQEALSSRRELQGAITSHAATQPGTKERTRARVDLTAAEGKAVTAGTKLQSEREGLEEASQALQGYNKELQAAMTQREASGEAAVNAAQQQQAAEQGLSEATRQQSQTAIQGMQAEVTAAQQVVAQRRQALAAAKDAVTAAKTSSDAAKATQQEQKRVWNESKEAVTSAKKAEADAIKEVATVQKSGSDAAKETAAKAKDDATAQVEAAEERAEAEKKAYTDTKTAAEEAQQGVSKATRARETAQNSLTKANDTQKASSDRLRKSKTQLAKTDRDGAKRAKDAQKEFTKTTKTYTKQQNALNKLAKKHGEFNVTVGKSADEMNELEKEVDDVIRSNKKYADSIDKIVAKQGKFNLNVSQGGFARASNLPSGTKMRQAGFAAQRIGMPGMAAIGEAAAVAGPVGIAIAGTLLAVKALTQALMAMAKAAFQAFQAIVKGAVTAAKEIELADAQFTAFFEGDTAAAEASLQKLRDLSVELGQNVVGVGRAFLPEVESLDQLEQVVKVATALARFQPEQGQLGSRIALQEALGGEFRSLQRRFEISPVAIDKIRNAFQTTGVTGLLTELQAELERTGRSVEDLSDTFGVAEGRIKERLRQIQAEMGEPIIDELSNQFKEIDDVLEELNPDLMGISNAFGEILAKLVEILGTEVENFLENFDPAPVFEVAEALFGVADAFGILVFGFNAGEGAAGGLSAGLMGLAGVLLNVEGFFLDASLKIAEFREDMQSILPVIKVLNDITEGTLRYTPGLPGGGMAADLASVLHDAQEGFIATGASVEEVTAKIALHDQEVLDFANGITAYALALSEGNEEGEKAADTFLSMGDKLAELQSIQEQYSETQKKVNEAVREFDVAATLRFEKLLTDATRRRMQAEIDNAQKLIDIDRKNKLKIADIQSAFESNVVKAAVSLNDKEQDIARKHGDAVLDLEGDLNDDRISAEEKYQEELRRLRDKFNFDAFEAMLANDGKALRQIRRRQAFEEDQLKKNRNDEIDDVTQKGDDRRAELDKQLQRELRDARIVSARKIRDLDTALQEQLAKQEQARQREVEAQAIAERRKTAVLNEQLNQALDDYRTWWDERSRVTTEKSADDLALLQKYIDDALALMNQLAGQGIVFNPLTGKPEFSYTPLSIDTTDTSTLAIDHIRELVVSLVRAQEMMAGGAVRADSTIAEEVAALSIEDLVDTFDKLRGTVDLALAMPEAENVWDAFDRYSFDTTNLAHTLMMEQALKLGGMVGIGAQEIINETLGLSMKDLDAWIQGFINKYTLPDLDDFSIFGESATGIPGIPGGMSMVTPGTPGAPFIIPSGAMSTNVSEDAPISGISGGGIFSAGAVQAIPGQPIFTFPNVTESPFGAQQAAPWTGSGTGLVGAPSFGEGVSAFPNFMTGMFGPSVFPTNPAAGFDSAAFNDVLQGQIDSQIAAEMIKRGEIEVTSDLAVLLAEQDLLSIESMLNGSVVAFQATSDAEIAILEQTIAKQQETLNALRADPALEEEAKAVEAALVILNDVLEQKREELAAATQEILDMETAATLLAEGDKQDAVDETVVSGGQAALMKLADVETGVEGEVAATEQSETQKVVILKEGAFRKKEVEDEYHAEILEADADHQEERAELTENAFVEAVDIADAFWVDWLRENNMGMAADYRQLYEWIKQRNQILATATPIIPGMGTIPADNDGDPDDTGGGATVTEAELEQMAINFADELGILTPLIQGDIMDMGYQELVDFVTWLQEQLGQRYLGGGFGPGPLLVGERGPEIIDMPGAGRIIPNHSPVFSNMLTSGARGGSMTINNTMDVTNQFPDPRGIPPTYIKAMENIAVRVAKRTWAGK